VSATKGRPWSVPSVLPIYGVAELYSPNPEFDPVISYWLRDAGSTPATIRISDARGTVVRTMTGPSAQGLNRVIWDMRMDAAIPDVGTGGGRGGARGGPQSSGGPPVMPGAYRVAIDIPGVATPLRGDLTVQSDPRDRTFTTAQRTERHSAMMAVYELQKTLARVRTRIDGRARAEADRLVGVTGTLLRALEAFNSAPTADQRQEIAWARDDVARLAAMVSPSGGRP
jgi:hypothetical protein